MSQWNLGRDHELDAPSRSIWFHFGSRYIAFVSKPRGCFVELTDFDCGPDSLTNAKEPGTGHKNSGVARASHHGSRNRLKGSVKKFFMRCIGISSCDSFRVKGCTHFIQDGGYRMSTMIELQCIGNGRMFKTSWLRDNSENATSRAWIDCRVSILILGDLRSLWSDDGHLFSGIKQPWWWESWDIKWTTRLTLPMARNIWSATIRSMWEQYVFFDAFYITRM